ncbi:MAG: metal ABC transporter permease [Alphaproteobacteria bacterium]|nr:metal ABC transporter permease [Alphaproteobacteria bacterium]
MIDLAWPHAWFIWPTLALAAGLWALAPLGQQVLQRQVVFIDLAVAQACAAAALWSGAWLHWHEPWQTQAVAALGAVACGALVALLNRRWPMQREALIGILYVCGAALALLGARLDPHGQEQFMVLIAADVLWVQPAQVLVLAACAMVLVWLTRGPRSRLADDRWFYPVFALVASVAVPALGLMLVFASLMTPALWLARGVGVARTYALSAIALGLGLAVSWWLDAPSGPCCALALGLAGLCSAWGRSESESS